MTIERGRIKIIYNLSEPINTKLDKDLDRVLTGNGFRFYASGYDLVNKARELIYEVE